MKCTDYELARLVRWLENSKGYTVRIQADYTVAIRKPMPSTGAKGTNFGPKIVGEGLADAIRKAQEMDL